MNSMAEGCINCLHWANILWSCVSGGWCAVVSGRGASSSSGGVGPVCWVVCGTHGNSDGGSNEASLVQKLANVNEETDV